VATDILLVYKVFIKNKEKRSTQKKNCMILASNVHEMYIIGKSRFSQNATNAVEDHRNCQKAHCHYMSIIPPKDEKPCINA
jgi:hypothetical protein